MATPDEDRLSDIKTEAQIWQLALEDTLAINEHIEKIHNAVVNNLLPEAVNQILKDQRLHHLLMAVVNEVQAEIVEGQENMVNIIRLAEGRLRMLRAEKDGDTEE